MKKGFSWRDVHSWLVFFSGLASVMGLILLPYRPEINSNFLTYAILIFDIPAYSVLSLISGSMFINKYKKWEGKDGWRITYGLALGGLGLALYMVFVVAFMFPPS